MDPREIDALVQRLVQDPHDQDAILHAHSAGQQDPRAYAMLLEKVGTATVDPALASHWLTEAANVWVLSLNDAHRAARALMIAIDRDPTQGTPAERLGELYREKGDMKALAALLERRAKALAPLAQRDASIRLQVAGIHEELGRLCAEPPLSNAAKAVENYRRALDYDPGSQYAIYSLREVYKSAGQFADALPYYAMEQSLVDDPERKVALYADEAEARNQVGDANGAFEALDNARRLDPNDPSLKQQLGTLVLERVRGGQPVDESWKAVGAQLFVELAEEYAGDHGYAYSTCALEILPGHDRAVQLAIYYGEQLGRQRDVAPYAASYLKANPNGALAAEARTAAGDSVPRAVAAAARSAGGPARVSRAPVQPDRTVDDLGPSSEDEPELDEDAVDNLLEKALGLLKKNRKNEAAGVYRDVLKGDPTNSDALAFLQTHLRGARRYGDLRDVLLRAAKSEDADLEARAGWLREVAGLCETQLRDFETAIVAWQELLALDAGESDAREQLRRLLERASRWDDLATLLQEEAEQESDVEVRISTEKQLAKLHETKRKDFAAAGEAWARIATLTPEDETAIGTAVKFFEKGERPDLAAQVIAENVGSVADEPARGGLYKKLGELRHAAGDLVLAGDAFAEAARIANDAAGWETAEHAFVEAEAWAKAATAVDERATLARSPKQQAGLYATEADYLVRAGDVEGAIGRLDQAVDADPTDDVIAEALEGHLEGADRGAEIAAMLLRRSDKHPDKTVRIGLRKRAAKLQRELGDPALARESLELVLLDGDDGEALSLLADDAEERGEFVEAVDYLQKLARATSDRSEIARVVLREARLLAEGVRDVDAAVEQYERVLAELDSKSDEALVHLANLEEQRHNYGAAARALERRLELVTGPELKTEIATRLADLYEHHLDDPRLALRSLNAVFAADPDDFEAVQRIVELAERLEDWPLVAEHLARLVEVEGDEDEASRMTRRLAELLTERLDRGDDALEALSGLAEQGDGPCREAYVELGDRLGKKRLVASKLVEWYGQTSPSAERDDQLHGAFARFVEVSAGEEAASVAKELARLRVARREIAEPLEEVSIALRDLDALSIAHDLMARELSGSSRAEEMVRQAEVLVKAGVDPLEAVQHGEQALTSVAPEEVEPLLERLGKLVGAPGHVVDLYERQIGRCKSPADRLGALARAAQVAGERDALDRARGFFDIALGAGVQEETIEALERIARVTDEERGRTALRATLAEALAAGGQGSRDGGRTRSALLRRAALMANRELGDRDRAFTWLGDALVTHVDDPALDALVDLANEVGEPPRAEAVLTRALSEVFDGPLVRKLLGRRAALRSDLLSDPRGAAEDLKRLHELAPSDAEVMDKLAALYTQLEDYRGMVALYEDQILRGRDQTQRADLARKVARLWEERLDDAREAADAWRRVLRMKAGDPEATQGLDRAKANMLKRPPPVEEDEAPPPPKVEPARERPVKVEAPVVQEEPTPEPEPAPETEAEGPRGDRDTPAVPAAEADLRESEAREEPEAEAANDSESREGASAPTNGGWVDDEKTILHDIPPEALEAAFANTKSDAPAEAPEPERASAPNQNDDEAPGESDLDVDVDVSMTEPPERPRHSTPPPFPPQGRPPAGPRPPPPPSMRTSRPPPPPSLRRAAPPPPARSKAPAAVTSPAPPPWAAAAPEAEAKPPKGKRKKGKKGARPRSASEGSNENGVELDEDGEDVGDDELFE